MLSGYILVVDSAAATQKFPFLHFRLAAEGWGEEPRKKCKEIFDLPRRSEAEAGEARLGDLSGRFSPKPHARGACEVSQGSAGNGF